MRKRFRRPGNGDRVGLKRRGVGKRIGESPLSGRNFLKSLGPLPGKGLGKRKKD